MIQEQKAKAYDEVLNKLRRYMAQGVDPLITRADVQDFFPELKESEDERIKKALICGMYALKEQHRTCFASIPIDNVIAWLEKQSLQNPSESSEEVELIPDIDKPKFAVGAYVTDDGETFFHIISYDNNTYQLETVDGTSSHFHQEFIEKKYRLWSIEDAKDGDVLACESGWTCIFKTLVNDETFSSYCFMDNTKWFCETGSECHTLKEEFAKAYNGKIYPATKEQRDTLMKAMADAGYTFDFEKKELKKIEDEIEIPFGAKDSELQEATYYIPKGFHAEIDEDKVVIKKGEKPTAWSEDDDIMLYKIIDFFENRTVTLPYNVWTYIPWLKSLKGRVGCEVNCTTTKKWKESLATADLENSLCDIQDGFSDTSYEYRTLGEAIEFIRCTESKPQWKPSDEQIKALHDLNLTGNISYAEQGQVLIELYDDLKRLLKI